MNYNELPPELKVMILKKLSTLDLFNLIRKQEAPGDTDVAPIEGSSGSLKDFYKLARFELFERRGQEACRYQNLMIKAWIKQWSISKNLSFIQNDEDKQAWLKKLTGAMEDSAASIEHKLRCSLLINKLYPNVNDNVYKIVESLDWSSVDISFAPISIVFFDELNDKNKNDFVDTVIEAARIPQDGYLSFRIRNECYEILTALGSAFPKEKIDFVIEQVAADPRPQLAHYDFLGTLGSICDQDSVQAKQILDWLMYNYKHCPGGVGKTLSKLALCWQNKRKIIMDFLFQDLKLHLILSESFILLLPFATLEQKNQIFDFLIDKEKSDDIYVAGMALECLAKLVKVFNFSQKNQIFAIFSLVLNGTNHRDKDVFEHIRKTTPVLLRYLAYACDEPQKIDFLQMLSDEVFTQLRDGKFEFENPDVQGDLVLSIGNYAEICSQDQAGVLFNIIIKSLQFTCERKFEWKPIKALDLIAKRCTANQLIPHIDFLIKLTHETYDPDLKQNLYATCTSLAFACTEEQINKLYLKIAERYTHVLTLTQKYISRKEFTGSLFSKSESVLFGLMLNLVPYLKDAQLSKLKKLCWPGGKSLIVDYTIEFNNHVKALKENKFNRYELFSKNAQDNIEEIKPSMTYQYQPNHDVIEAVNDSNLPKLPLEDNRVIFQHMSQLRRKSDDENISAFELFKHELQNTFTHSWNPFKRSEMLHLMKNGTINTIDDVVNTINSPNNQEKFSRSREIMRRLGN